MTSNKAQALAYLTRHAGAWVTAQELIDAGAGYRFGARIAELRREGHTIDAHRIGGRWCYRLDVPGQTALWDAA